MEEKNKAAQELRSIPSVKRDAAVRDNVKLAQAARRKASVCTCRRPRLDGTHESGCHVYQAEYQRERRAAAKATG